MYHAITRCPSPDYFTFRTILGVPSHFLTDRKPSQIITTPIKVAVLSPFYFFSTVFVALAENICCHTSIHSRCRWESILCGLRTISAMISRTRMLNRLNASICFQSRTENRRRLLSTKITPEYIYSFRQ